MVLYYPVRREYIVMRSLISAAHAPFQLQMLMNKPKLYKHKLQRGWILCLYSWLFFLCKTQTDRAVSWLSTPRTFERDYLIAQLLSAALSDLGCELACWAWEHPTPPAMPTTEEQLLGGSSSKRKLERLERSWNNGQIYLRFTYCNRISLAKSLHLMNEDAHVSQQDEQDHPPYPAPPSPSPLNPRAQVKHSRLSQSILQMARLCWWWEQTVRFWGQDLPLWKDIFHRHAAGNSRLFPAIDAPRVGRGCFRSTGHLHIVFNSPRSSKLGSVYEI